MRAPVVLPELVDQVVALARSGARSGRPGGWERLVLRAEAIQEQPGSSPGRGLERLYIAEHEALISTGNEMMLPPTRERFLDIVDHVVAYPTSAVPDGVLSWRPPPAGSLERIFEGLGRPSPGRWTKDNPSDRVLERAANARMLEARSAIARYLHSFDASDFGKALYWLEQIAGSVGEGDGHPIARIAGFGDLQLFLRAALTGAMQEHRCAAFTEIVSKRTAVEFDPGASEAEGDGFAPWRDQTNWFRFTYGRYGNWWSFRPLSERDQFGFEVVDPRSVPG